jgi:hypothetical protein
MRRILSALLLVALPVLAALAPTAKAGTVERLYADDFSGGKGPSRDVGELRFTATPGTGADLLVSASQNDVEVVDLSGLEVGQGCVRTGATSARCTRAAVAKIEGDAGADVLRVAGPIDAIVRGGDGDDRLIGGKHLYAGAGDDELVARPDGSRMVGGPGADRFTGGQGVDFVEYGDHTGPVHADLEGDADDGEPGEGDHIGPAINGLTGGKGEDVLIGDDGPNSLSATEPYGTAPAVDRVVAGGGNDNVDGDGDDVLEAGDGDDYVHARGTTSAPLGIVDGGPGDDTLAGTIFAEHLRGGPGRDIFHAVGGADVLDARDGEADKIECRHNFAPSSAVARIDVFDVATDCARLEREVPARAAILSASALTRTVVVGCPRDHGRACRIRVRLSAGGRTIVDRRAVVRSGAQHLVRIRGRSRTVRIRVDTRDAAGQPVVVRGTAL